jgi:hypothetical protein
MASFGNELFKKFNRVTPTGLEKDQAIVVSAINTIYSILDVLI